MPAPAFLLSHLPIKDFMSHWRNQRHTTTDAGTKALVRTGDLSVGAVSVFTATAGYLQMFDAAAAADVTLGTTPPTLSRYFPANNEEPFTLQDRPLYFSLGLVYAFTTTRTGSTAQACATTFWFERE